jgi:hypothetical protein
MKTLSFSPISLLFFRQRRRSVNCHGSPGQWPHCHPVSGPPSGAAGSQAGSRDGHGGSAGTSGEAGNPETILRRPQAADFECRLFSGKDRRLSLTFMNLILFEAIWKS